MIEVKVIEYPDPLCIKQASLYLVDCHYYNGSHFNQFSSIIRPYNSRSPYIFGMTHGRELVIIVSCVSLSGVSMLCTEII